MTRRSGVLLAMLPPLAVASVAIASPSPSPSSTAAAAPTYVLTCDNGQTYDLTAAGDGSATISGLPAGTVCTATLPASKSTLSLPPVPAGGVAAGIFDGPYLQLSPSVGYPGFTTQAIGQGFPPNSTVTLTWNVAHDPTTVAQTDATGAFSSVVLVPAGDVAGRRSLHATSADAPVVRAKYLVQPRSFAPAGDSGQEFRQ
ncbi:MAG TPA: hypothetical protein VHV76_05120 [Mycobacteriales bacterium]|jgi:hypothetical protein|nr:hypothetical protein [Mycobacteriales bacterium]